MNAALSPLPEESDVHLSVFLHGARFDFAACLTAALIFICDYQEHNYIGAVNIIPGDTTGLPRLPAERLYLEP